MPQSMPIKLHHFLLLAKHKKTQVIKGASHCCLHALDVKTGRVCSLCLSPRVCLFFLVSPSLCGSLHQRKQRGGCVDLSRSLRAIRSHRYHNGTVAAAVLLEEEELIGNRWRSEEQFIGHFIYYAQLSNCESCYPLTRTFQVVPVIFCYWSAFHNCLSLFQFASLSASDYSNHEQLIIDTHNPHFVYGVVG